MGANYIISMAVKKLAWSEAGENICGYNMRIDLVISAYFLFHVSLWVRRLYMDWQ